MPPDELERLNRDELIALARQLHVVISSDWERTLIQQALEDHIFGHQQSLF